MGKGRKTGKDTQVFPFHNIISSTLSGGTQNFLVAPNGNMTPRGQTEADAWQHYRVEKLSFRLHPVGAATSTMAGYIGGVPDTPPTTIAQIAELLPSCFLGLQSTKPTEWVNVPKIDLAGPLPWYKTVPGTADPTEEAPGYVMLGGTGTAAFVLEIRGVLRFKTSSATANTPLSISLRQRIREERTLLAMQKERLLLFKLLGTPDVPQAPSLAQQVRAAVFSTPGGQ